MPTQVIAGTDADARSDIALWVRADKLRLLFRQSFPALFISYATALLLAWMLWGHTGETALLAWLGALALATVIRLSVFLSYFRMRVRGANVLRLERPYAISLMVSSLTWGIGALLVMPADSLLHQAITLFILIGMAGGAVAVYSARFPMVVAAMAAVLLPGTLWLYLQPAREQIGLAVGASLFMLAMLRTAKVLAEALQGNFQLRHELSAAHAVAEEQARTDPLTGLANRRAFLDHGEQIIRYCERHGLSLHVIVMDVDNFKTINDTLGHSAGDAVLRDVSDTIRRLFRRSDVCGRIGGEEFAVVLPHTSERDAVAIAEKVRNTIADTDVAWGNQRLKVTVSIGVADAGFDLGALLARADKAMYRAKEQGRNQVVYYAESYSAGRD